MRSPALILPAVLVAFILMSGTVCAIKPSDTPSMYSASPSAMDVKNPTPKMSLNGARLYIPSYGALTVDLTVDEQKVGAPPILYVDMTDFGFYHSCIALVRGGCAGGEVEYSDCWNAQGRHESYQLNPREDGHYCIVGSWWVPDAGNSWFPEGKKSEIFVLHSASFAVKPAEAVTGELADLMPQCRKAPATGAR